MGIMSFSVGEETMSKRSGDSPMGTQLAHWVTSNSTVPWRQMSAWWTHRENFPQDGYTGRSSW